MLADQALCVIVLGECAGWGDPMEADIGGRKAGESAEGQDSGPHGVTLERVSRWSRVHSREFQEVVV